MRVVLTGGGSGGHFYPIISIAQELNALAQEQKLVEHKLYYVSDSPYNAGLLFDNQITYKKNSSGKLRRYFSFLNFFDLFKTGWGILRSLWILFWIYPDVVFAKGAYASFPVLFAARLLNIPVVIHESDSVPGRANAWAGKFAERIAVSYKEAATFFPAEKVAYTGQPLRKELLLPAPPGIHTTLGLDLETPIILILGGSLGSQIINESIIDALPELVKKYQVVHQTGKDNIKSIKDEAEAVLFNNPNKDRYKPFDYLDSITMRGVAQISSVIISRAGSTIFEIAAWGIPSLIIPITDSNGDHQRKNAYAYARAGACFVIEEKNLTPHIVISEIERIMGNPQEKERMHNAALGFVKTNAARLIAEEILRIALSHES